MSASWEIKQNLILTLFLIVVRVLVVLLPYITFFCNIFIERSTESGSTGAPLFVQLNVHCMFCQMSIFGQRFSSAIISNILIYSSSCSIFQSRSGSRTCTGCPGRNKSTFLVYDLGLNFRVRILRLFGVSCSCQCNCLVANEWLLFAATSWGRWTILLKPTVGWVYESSWKDMICAFSATITINNTKKHWKKILPHTANARVLLIQLFD